MRKELEQFLRCTDDKRVDSRRWILEHQRAVELRRELHIDEILVRLFRGDDEPEHNGEKQRRALERKTLSEHLGQTPPPGGDGTRARAALRLGSRHRRHGRLIVFPSRPPPLRSMRLTTRRTARDWRPSSSPRRRST